MRGTSWQSSGRAVCTNWTSFSGLRKLHQGARESYWQSTHCCHSALLPFSSSSACPSYKYSDTCDVMITNATCLHSSELSPRLPAFEPLRPALTLIAPLLATYAPPHRSFAPSGGSSTSLTTIQGLVKPCTSLFFRICNDADHPNACGRLLRCTPGAEMEAAPS